MLMKLQHLYQIKKIIVGATCIGSQAKDIMTVIALMIKLEVKVTNVSTFFASHPSATELSFNLIGDVFIQT